LDIRHTRVHVPPLLSLSPLLPAVMLSCGTENLLSYNKSLDASGGSVFRN
jgi:hypothetical protein